MSREVVFLIEEVEFFEEVKFIYEFISDHARLKMLKINGFKWLPDQRYLYFSMSESATPNKEIKSMILTHIRYFLSKKEFDIIWEVRDTCLL